MKIPTGGRRRIQGELARLAHPVAASTVWEILHAAGIAPAPRRSGPTWRNFLTSQAQGILAADLCHIDTAQGKRLHAMAFIEHGTRRPHITGMTTHPTAQWAVQQARNIAAEPGERGAEPRFLLRDRNSKYTDAFDAVFTTEDTEVLLSDPWAPRINAHCQRVIGTIHREALDHVLPLGESHTRKVLTDYQDHYNGHRPHRSRQHLPPSATGQPAIVHDLDDRGLRRTRVLGGIINSGSHQSGPPRRNQRHHPRPLTPPLQPGRTPLASQNTDAPLDADTDLRQRLAFSPKLTPHQARPPDTSSENTPDGSHSTFSSPAQPRTHAPTHTRAQ
ncbi:integrase core domain-containing protein [Streptomyces sp. NPDC007164]|uniref:integrase core domain-containing protein n=1 Tax=Streptomyces sp. NPDC007164 TaxID=3156918 RepID=UPI0033E87563